MFREKKEFLVFRSLLRLVPGFEARLMASSEEEVLSITDLGRPTPTVSLYRLTYFYRFRKAQLVLGQMTPRAWRLQSSTGSPQRDNPWPPTFRVTWSPGVASTTSVLVRFFVRQVLIGRIQSTSLLTFRVDFHLIPAQHKVKTHEWPNPSSRRPVASLPVRELCIWRRRSMERALA